MSLECVSIALMLKKLLKIICKQQSICALSLLNFMSKMLIKGKKSMGK